MRVDLGDGRGWLEDPAAKSLRRLDLRIGHRWQITEAGRTYEQQQKHYDIYLRDGYPIALAPWTPSIHQIGAAIDTNERMTWLLNEYGWYHTVYRNGQLMEEWHYEYFASKDQHINEPVQLTQGSDGVWRFAEDAPPTPIAPRGFEEMIIYIASTTGPLKIVTKGDAYIQGTDGPLRRLDGRELSAYEYFRKAGNTSFIYNDLWGGDTIEALMKVVGLRSFRAPGRFDDGLSGQIVFPGEGERYPEVKTINPGGMTDAQVLALAKAITEATKFPTAAENATAVRQILAKQPLEIAGTAK